MWNKIQRKWTNFQHTAESRTNIVSWLGYKRVHWYSMLKVNILYLSWPEVCVCLHLFIDNVCVRCILSLLYRIILFKWRIHILATAVLMLLYFGSVAFIEKNKKFLRVGIESDVLFRWFLLFCWIRSKYIYRDR